MGKKAPKPPDLRPISDAQLKIADQMNTTALKQLGLSEQQFAYFKEQGTAELAFAREQAAKNLALQERALDSGEAAQAEYAQLTASQKRLMDQAYEYSQEDRQRYNDVAIPLQDKIIAEANGWDSPERQAQMAAQAQADVQRNADAQRRNVDSQLAGLGIDPSQMRAGAIANTMGLQTAAAGAMQGNNARQQTQQQGIAMRGNAANIVAGLPAQGANQQGLSMNAGGNAANMVGQGQNSQLAGINTYAGLGTNAANLRAGAVNNMANWTGSPTQWASMGNNSMGMSSNSIMNAGNVMTQGYQNRLQQASTQANMNNGFMSSLGSLAGGIAMFVEGGAADKKTWKERYDSMTPAERVAEAKKGWDAGGGFQGGYEDAPLTNTLEQTFYANGGSVMPQPAGPGMGGIPSAPPMGGPMMGRNPNYVPPVGRPQPQPMQMLAEGHRGAVPTQQSEDRIQAMIAHGEYIVPADVVRAKGVEFFDRLSQKYHKVGT